MSKHAALAAKPLNKLLEQERLLPAVRNFQPVCRIVVGRNAVRGRPELGKKRKHISRLSFLQPIPNSFLPPAH
ncbi:hypothetical protein ACFQZT_05830 [Paenibacillus sp. GCM10027628]|uniref:hypothetical protein n=1 Tax=Paenibacillus sp. GCM10027628 TaxID=3273413 RepID=UPI00363E36BE